MPDAQMDVLGLLPEDRPLAYERLPDAEKRWRGRYFLMLYALDASEQFAWSNALDCVGEVEAEAKALVLRTPDWQIVEALRNKNADRATLPETPGTGTPVH